MKMNVCARLALVNNTIHSLVNEDSKFLSYKKCGITK